MLWVPMGNMRLLTREVITVRLKVVLSFVSELMSPTGTGVVAKLYIIWSSKAPKENGLQDWEELNRSQLIGIKHFNLDTRNSLISQLDV